MKSVFAFMFCLLAGSLSQAYVFDCRVTMENPDGSLRTLGRMEVDSLRSTGSTVVLNKAGDKLSCGSYIEDSFHGLLCVYAPYGTEIVFNKNLIKARKKVYIRNRVTGKVTTTNWGLTEHSSPYFFLGTTTNNPNGEEQPYYTDCIRK